MHLGVIIDGNRRWAKENNKPALQGHKKGLENVKNLIFWAKERGVKTLSIFVFSTENWKRNKSEVNYLMKLANSAISGFKDLKDIKLRVIGLKKTLPLKLQKTIEKIEKEEDNSSQMTVNFALSYGGRAEIADAVKRIIEGGIKPEDVTEELISKNLWTEDLDLIIRTGKEQRISNFLIWQSAYSELYFSPKYWPDFQEIDLDKALEEYANRKRRFGK